MVRAAILLAAVGLLGSTGVEVAAADDAAWTPTGRLQVARDFATATVLRNGKVLVAGGMRAKGTGAGGYLASAELYNPRTRRWSATGSMLHGRVHHTATLLRNGKVLVAGGYGAGGFRASAELYDPATRRWKATGHMALPRDEHTATALRNGQVLVAGGDDDGVALASAELYHPKTGKWSRAGKFASARYSHTATRLPDGHVLIAGGYNAHAALASARVYSPATGKWSTAGSMTARRFRHTATLLADGRVLVAGGARSTSSRGYLSSAELYDPATGAWSATAGTGVARYLATATRLRDGRVLVAGGRGPGYLSSAELYDPATGTWSAPAIMAAARFRHTASLLRNGTVLVAGGYGPGGPLRGAELYRSQPLPGVPAAPGPPPVGGPPPPLPGPLDHLSLSPAAATVGSGAKQAYRVEGFDAAGHDLGDVTGASTLSIAPDGTCDDAGHTCASLVADTTGRHTVTATDGRARGTATLTVTRATTLVGSDQLGFCALLVSGGVKCWGIGAGADGPVAIRGVGGAGTLSGVTSLAGSGYGYCALLASGHVDCWNAGDDVPVALPGPGGTGTLSGVEQLVSDAASSYCALLSSGGVVCWGDNGAGELGNGTSTTSLTPVAVLGVGGVGTLSGASSLAPGFRSYCAILTSTGLACWGYNNHGELGDGTGGPEACSNGLGCSTTPLRVIGLGGNGLMSGVVSLASTGSAGSGGSFCAVLAGNGVACWGWNYSAGGSQFDPSSVEGLGGSVVRKLVGNGAVSAGTQDGTYCAILNSGAVDCWRRGTEGQLGDGQASNSTLVVEPGGVHFHDVPVAVSGTGGAGRLGVVGMAAGEESFCAVLISGGVDCWGANVLGDLGIGTMTGPSSCLFSQPCSTVPRAVAGVAGRGILSNAVGVASDTQSYCAALASGGVDCWGQDTSGQLGDGSTIDSSVPVVALPGS